jgi:hypothetical protein
MAPPVRNWVSQSTKLVCQYNWTLANHAARERKGWLSVTRDQQPSGVRNDRNMGRYKKMVFQFKIMILKHV